MEYKYSYGICNVPDKKIYQAQCRALEKAVPRIKFEYEATDVDGSELAVYTKDEKKIVVHNSYYTGDVYVDSNIELTQFFKND